MVRRFFLGMFASILAVGMLGCGETRYDKTATAPEPSAERQPVAPTEPLVVNTNAEGAYTADVAPPPTKSAPDTSDASAPPAVPESEAGPISTGRSPASAGASAPTVELSVGVALPQTLPEGTAMTFSVDYETAAAPLDAVWCLKNGRNEMLRQPVRLDRQGNLAAIVPQWRPETGPFQSRIEDPSGRPLSRWIDMR
ncbi:hypothetical protein JCM19992_06140 [Thermostilla marina]